MVEAETRGWLISGRVQGVFFRASTQRQAEALGLRGHAFNLEDGRVEVVAQGLPEALERLEAWLRQGPAQAQVDQLLALPDAGRRVINPGAFRTG